MLPFLIVTLLILAAAVPGESFLSQFNANLHPSSARCVASRDLEDSADAAEFLDLSTSDLARIQTARSSRTVMPLIILAEPILPGQSIEFGSNDKRFHALIAHALQNNANEIGVLGTNPHTGWPLNIGVTAKVSASSIRRDDSDKAMVVLDVVGERRFECAGEPWMDDTSSFYLADIDYSNGRGDSHESSSANDTAGEEESIADSARACALSDSVPDLVETWTYWMAHTGICSQTSMKQIMEELGPMPDNVGERAIWVGILLNPVRGYSRRVCLEIRPAMLACASDLEQITLSCIALQSSIDHLCGKKLLF